MRRLMAVVGIVAIGCADPSPTSTTGGPSALAPSFSIGADGAPPIVFNTQLRSADEIPTSTSESIGHSHFAVRADGTIESQIMINNKAAENVFFCHIHWINPAITGALTGTGPVIWWLTSPVGARLNLTDRHIDLRQDAIFVGNRAFTTDEAVARAALLERPSEFYVNCHSTLFPGGFIRGNLP